MPNKFSEYTKKIQAKLPYWFKKMRTDDTSIGAQFLNVFGLGIEDLTYIINYAYEQCNIMKADVNQVSEIYKAFIPASINSSHTIMVTSDIHTLVPVDSLEAFFAAVNTDLAYSEIEIPNPYLIDYEKHYMYVKYPYDRDDTHKDGKVRLLVSQNDTVIIDTIISLTIHPVWNFFDELGLLLATPRLIGESNEDYKERILDVFKHPASASAQGLINGIARNLGLRKIMQWTDGSLNYVIHDKMVITNSIEIDNIPVPEELLYINNKGEVVIVGDEALTGVERTITWVSGFALHELHNKEDLVLQYQIDKPGKPLLQYILERINTSAPILWGNFIWDESFWDVGDEFTGRTPFQLDALY